MSGARGLVLFSIFGLAPALALAPACAKTVDRGFFQEQDFQPPKDSKGSELGDEAVFDRNNVIETAALVDFEALDAAKIQGFFHKTPYDRATFLETYQSNGVRASDAIARAARTYRISPFAFLIAAQGTQGLIGERNYPFPPERVEYVFRCGCLQGADCDANLAGFDRLRLPGCGLSDLGQPHGHGAVRIEAIGAYARLSVASVRRGPRAGDSSGWRGRAGANGDVCRRGH